MVSLSQAKSTATGALTSRAQSAREADIMGLKDFNLIHNGVSDDLPAFQAYADYCGAYGTDFVIPDAGNTPYRLSGKVVFKATRNLDATDTTPASDIHFTDNMPFRIIGRGNARVQATAAMSSMFELIFDTSDSDIGPFYTEIIGVHFDGADLAVAAVKSDYTMHVIFDNNRVHRCVRGVEYTGYGVFRARNNVMKCKYGFYLVGGGGDSLIESNDWFASENDCAFVYSGYTNGNMVITGNTTTNEASYTTSHGVRIVGSTAPASEENRHNVISNNEFCGLSVGVKANGKASGTKNVWNTIITGNHVTQFGANNPGTLVDLTDCTDFEIFGNFANSKRLVDATALAASFLRCERIRFHDNNIGAYLLAPVFLQDCSGVDVYDNLLIDCGKTASGYTIVDVYGTTGINRFFRNLFWQTSVSYAQNGIYERDGANFTYAWDNEFINVGAPLRKAATGVNSIMRRKETHEVSADNGDAAATLTAKVSAPTQRWATPLTADRAVTLSTTAAMSGDRFKIVRTAAATGAFSLNVGTGPLKALAVGTWCEVEFSGSAWVLTSYGAL